VSDHRRFGDDGFGDGFHGNVPDNRRRLVEQDQSKVAAPPRQGLQRLIKGRDNAHGVLQRPLDAHSPHNGAGNKGDFALPLHLGNGHLGGIIANVNPRDVSHTIRSPHLEPSSCPVAPELGMIPREPSRRLECR